MFPAHCSRGNNKLLETRSLENETQLGKKKETHVSKGDVFYIKLFNPFEEKNRIGTM